jgi:hypothetical protein
VGETHRSSCEVGVRPGSDVKQLGVEEGWTISAAGVSGVSNFNYSHGTCTIK